MKLLFENWRQYLKEERVPNVNVILYIKPSPIHGLGVFAGEQIPQGTDLGIAQTEQNEGYSVTLLGEYHNHSLEPSCENISDGSARHLVSSKNIEPGEEITINYTLQPDLEQPVEGWI